MSVMDANIITWAIGGFLGLLHLWARADAKAQHLETRKAILDAVEDKYAAAKDVNRDINEMRRRLDDHIDRCHPRSGKTPLDPFQRGDNV